MKYKGKMLPVALIAVILGILFVVTARVTRRQAIHGPSVHRSDPQNPQESSGAAPLPTNAGTAAHPVSSVSPADSPTPVVDPRGPAMPTLPTGMRYMPPAAVSGGEVLLPILDVVSNAVLRVNRMLDTRQYRVVELFGGGGSVWLEVTDSEKATIWRLTPFGTNQAVAVIRRMVFADDSFSRKDRERSFQAHFDPETGRLRKFMWEDAHEALFVQTNGPFAVDYARRLEGNLELLMRWNHSGHLVSSNVYNRANWGGAVRGPLK